MRSQNFVFAQSCQEAERAIQRREESLMHMQPNSMNVCMASYLVHQDLLSLNAIRDTSLRHFAACAMAELARTHWNYRAELLRQDPRASTEVQRAEQENARRSALKEKRKAHWLSTFILKGLRRSHATT